MSAVLRRLADVERRDDGRSDVLVVASSGGHLTQALLAMPRGHRFHLVTNRAGVAGGDGRVISVTVPHHDTHRSPLVHALGVVLAASLHRHLGIARTFSTGGAVALPFAVVSRARRQPFVYLDTLSRVEDLSSTARLVHRLHLATDLFAQWPDVAANHRGVRHAGAVAPVRRQRDE
jgi:hypothetical protein